MWDQYTWIFVLSLIGAFFAAFGIGANDVANSFASSVGAKAITMPQALIIAAICEFSGAMLLGASVTNTIRSNIARVAQFQNTPELLMYGSMCVIFAAAFWDNFACHLELPVSTTHTTIGATIGMALVLRGGGAVVWSAHKSTFPYLDGFAPVIMSWVVSPALSGLGTLILFGIIRTFVLRSEHSFTRSLMVMPIAVSLTLFVVVNFVIQTGNKNKSWGGPTGTVGDAKALWVSAIFFGAFFLIGTFVVVPYIKKKVEAADDYMQKAQAVEEGKVAHAEAVAKGEATGEYVGLDDVNAINPDRPGFLSNMFNKVGETKFGQAVANNKVARALSYGSRYKVHDVLDAKQGDIFDKDVAAIWQKAEVFDFKTERVFRYLQVFTAATMSFAHGANDTANAMGPFSAVHVIWETGKVPRSSPVPEWILALGGAGIVCGLATYGYKIMRVLGVKGAKLTNARGFCVEMATACTVIVASRYGIPVSTTQIITGAILAIGLFEGARGVNWKVFLRIFAGWVITLCVAAAVSGGLTAFGAYAPQKTASDDIYATSRTLNSNTQFMIRELNGTNNRASPINATTTAALNGFNRTLTNLLRQGTQSPPAVVSLNQNVFRLYNATYN